MLTFHAGCYFGIYAEEPFRSFYQVGDRAGLEVKGEVLSCQYIYIVHSSYLNTDKTYSVFFFKTSNLCDILYVSRDYTVATTFG